MSLRVDDGRSRGRSKSPGRKDERSRSRDVRAPSPAAIIQTKRSSKKYYSDESDSDTRPRKKSSKKHYDDSSESDSDPRSKKKSSKKRYDSDDSDSDPRSKRKSSRKHHDESDSDGKSKKKLSKKRYSDSDSDSKSKKRASKKHYDKSESSSSSSEDDRKSKHKGSKQVASTRKGEYVETSTSRHERERHGSYASPEHHDRPVEYKRHMSSSSVEGGEKYRQQSMPGGFIEGHSPHPQYALPSPLAKQLNSRLTDAVIGMPSHKSCLDPKVKECILGPSARMDQSMPNTSTQIRVLMHPTAESLPTQ